jgi:hypothetical protein
VEKLHAVFIHHYLDDEDLGLELGVQLLLYLEDTIRKQKGNCGMDTTWTDDGPSPRELASNSFMGKDFFRRIWRFW